MAEVARPRLTVGRIVHYWTDEAGELVPNAAIVIALGQQSPRAHLEVLYAGGYGGRTRLWADESEQPAEGRWTWPERA